MDKAIYINDLIHRFPGFQFSETTKGDLILVSFLDASEIIVSSSTNLNILDAYRTIRQDVLNRVAPVFLSTTDQRDNLIDVERGTIIFNLTTIRNEIFDGADWIGAGGEMGGVVHFKSATVTTMDNAPTIIKSLPLDEEFAFLVTAEIIGETIDHDDVAGFIIQCTAKRISGGSAEIIGNVTTAHSGKDTGASSWDATFVVSGNNLNVVVQGQISDTIVWKTDTQYLKF